MGALFGRGTSLQLKVSTTFQGINGLTKTDGPKINGKTVDITNHGSPTNFTEILGTVVELSWSCSLNFDPSDTVHQALRTAALGQTTSLFQYTKAGESTTPGAFSAVIKGWNESEDPNKQRIATFDLAVTGTFTAATH